MATITAKKRGGVEVSVEYNTGSTLQEKVDLFGEKVVEALADDALIVRLQAFMRPRIEKGETQEQIQAAVTSYKPGEGAHREPGAKAAATMLTIAEKFMKMTPEEQQAAVAELREQKRLREEAAAKAAAV